MRTKRKQKRKQVIPPKEKGLPDPFSANNPDLVEAEVNEADVCPCCVDRDIQIQLNRLEAEYLIWTQSDEKE